ncbi:MAG: hypothetical protein E7351_03560 [Clostridiales bacterium]|nr:hypothetical protein [Clostridiales bacterium]
MNECKIGLLNLKRGKIIRAKRSAEHELNKSKNEIERKILYAKVIRYRKDLDLVNTKIYSNIRFYKKKNIFMSDWDSTM